MANPLSAAPGSVGTVPFYIDPETKEIVFGLLETTNRYGDYTIYEFPKGTPDAFYENDDGDIVNVEFKVKAFDEAGQPMNHIRTLTDMTINNYVFEDYLYDENDNIAGVGYVHSERDERVSVQCQVNAYYYNPMDGEEIRIDGIGTLQDLENQGYLFSRFETAQETGDRETQEEHGFCVGRDINHVAQRVGMGPFTMEAKRGTYVQDIFFVQVDSPDSIPLRREVGKLDMKVRPGNHYDEAGTWGTLQDFEASLRQIEAYSERPDVRQDDKLFTLQQKQLKSSGSQFSALAVAEAVLESILKRQGVAVHASDYEIMQSQRIAANPQVEVINPDLISGLPGINPNQGGRVYP